MPHANDYLLPKEFLFLLETPLNLWDFLYYKKNLKDNWAVFYPYEVTHDPRLIRDRKDLNSFLTQEESKALLRVDKEFHGRKKRYLIELLHSPARSDLLPKPRGYHENGWVHELMSLEEHWLINLFLLIEHEANKTPLVTIDQLRTQIEGIADQKWQEMKKLKPIKPKLAKERKNERKKLLLLLDQSKPLLGLTLQSLIRLQLIIREELGFRLNKERFKQPAAPRYNPKIKDDFIAQRRLITTHILPESGLEIQEPALIELIRYWHQVGGLPQRLFVRAYHQLSRAQDIDYQDMVAYIKKQLSQRNRRDCTLSYQSLLKKYRQDKQKSKQKVKTPPIYSNKILHLRKEKWTIAGDTFYFEPPIPRERFNSLTGMPARPHPPLSNQMGRKHARKSPPNPFALAKRGPPSHDWPTPTHSARRITTH